jgi:hypothetical protein
MFIETNERKQASRNGRAGRHALDGARTALEWVGAQRQRRGSYRFS